VGIGHTTTSIVTHALIRDSEGNPIAVTKGLFDQITIYATIYVTLGEMSYGNTEWWGYTDVGDSKNYVNNLLVRYLLGEETNLDGRYMTSPAQSNKAVGYGIGSNTTISTDVNNRKIIFPQEINSIDGNNIDVYFSVPVSGYLNVAKGGHIISGSVGFTNLDLTNSNIVSSSVQVADYGYAITGSNTFIGDQGITGSLNIRKAKIDSTCVTVSSVTNQTIFDLHMFDGANFDYVIKNGSNMRGGVIMSVWDGTNVRYNETSTTDLGDTSGVTFSVTGTGLLRVSTISGTWSIEVLYRALSCS
jgi:hypothetical protein